MNARDVEIRIASRIAQIGQAEWDLSLIHI